MRCPHCGEETHSGRIYCPNCGERLVSLEDKQKERDRKNGLMKRIVALVAAVAILGGAGGYFLTRGFKGGPAKRPDVTSPATTAAETPTPQPIEEMPTPQPAVSDVTEAPTAQPIQTPEITLAPETIDTAAEFHDAIKDVIRRGDDHIDNVNLSDDVISAVSGDYCHYFDSWTWVSAYSIQGDAPKDIQYKLTPSRLAWNAYRDGTTPSDPEAAKLLQQAQSVVNQVIQSGMSDLDKELALHDYIINNCRYLIDEENRHTGDARGFFDYGCCQCSGYCDTFWLLGTMAGLDVEIISGEVNDPLDPDTAQKYNVDSNGHAWNLIQLDGKWYGLDVTWDDPVGDEDSLTYTYFNVPVSAFERTRTWDREQDPVGTYAQTIDGNYQYVRLYDRPEYKFATADGAAQSAIDQIDRSGKSIICLTNKPMAQSIADSIAGEIANHYQMTSWTYCLIGEEDPFAPELPFYVYSFDLGQ